MQLKNKSEAISPNKFKRIQEPTDDEFNLFRELVLKDLGLEWGDDKKYLLYARVQKILQINQLENFQSYYHYIKQKENGKERQNLYNAVTTTKSGFYREKQHFKFLRENVFPEMKEHKKNRYSKLRFWSAGCSSGEETYTLAMEAYDFFGTAMISNGGLRILGSDVNSNVLGLATNGTYSEDQISTIPDSLRKRFFIPKPVGIKNTQIRINREVQKIIQFRQFNLMDNTYPIATKFQLIFCRNLLYYLHPDKREYLLKKLVDHLETGGWLVLGITETGYKVEGMNKMAFSVYQKN
tara:strand:+ start:126 stop:1010 length:885 start_codon:yes stop_codon:yes gene_type:complete